MDQPKFEIGQKVKFSGDHDRSTGEILEYKYDSTGGFTYTISSKYYDTEKNDMVEGVKICKEEELTDMTGYTGDTTPEIPNHTVTLTDQVAAAPETPAEEQPAEEQPQDATPPEETPADTQPAPDSTDTTTNNE